MYVSYRKHVASLTLAFVILSCSPQPCMTQANQSANVLAQFVPFVMKAYRAFERKDREFLHSICSASSPHCSPFREILHEQSALTQNLKLELKRIWILKASVENDRAEVRVLANFVGLDERGKPAEGIPGEWDHTLFLIKENNEWKLWRFTDTAEEFADTYLQTTSEQEGARLITKAEPHTYGFIRGLNEEAQSLLETRGETRQAAKIFAVASGIALQAKDIEGDASAQIGMGDVYLAQGDYVRAADNYQKILTLAEKLKSKEAVAAVSAKMGNLHYQQGNSTLAMEYYLRSVRLYEEVGSKLEITYPLVNLGSAYFALGEHEKALEHYQKIYRIYDQFHARSGIAWLLNKTADVYATQGKTDLATAEYNRALKAQEELGNKPMQAYALTGLGRIRLHEKNYVEALVLFTRAAALSRAADAPEILWKALNLIGQTQRALGKLDDARQAISESIEVVERLRNQVAGNERDQGLAFETRTAPYVEMLELLVEQKDYSSAFAYAERAKGRMLFDVLRNGRTDISRSMTAEEIDREQTLNATMTALSNQVRQESFLPRPDEKKLSDLEQRLRQARSEYESYEARIYAAHPELKAQRGIAPTVSNKELESLLPDSAVAFLEYVVAPRQTYLFVITRRGAGDPIDMQVVKIQVSAPDLGRMVTDYRQTLARNSPAFKEAARNLYELLLKPAESQLSGKSMVGIVPSNQLWELPFQTLVSASDRYFIQDHALFYSPSLSVLGEMRKKSDQHAGAFQQRETVVKVTPASSPTQTLLALGNPKLSNNLVLKSKQHDRSLSLNDLPEAEREVKTLAEIYGVGRSKVFTGIAAREEIVKAEAANYPILHFATHGILDDDNPLYSRLLLANSSIDNDGLLEAREILKLDLHADLAVLSACQTARGKVSAGEGLIGISWAFFIAGASTTVVSQWKVDSASTARLMVDFHRLLQPAGDGTRLSKAEAMRQAGLKLMSDPKYRHPFFWSGFIVVGNGM